jgi:hypothetical protein
MDLIGSLPFEKQLELLEMGRSIFLDIFCSPPSAFRAACYGASTSTLDALERIGIQYDSSFNAACLGSSCLMNSRSATNIPSEMVLYGRYPSRLSKPVLGDCAA